MGDGLPRGRNGLVCYPDGHLGVYTNLNEDLLDRIEKMCTHVLYASKPTSLRLKVEDNKSLDQAVV